MCIFCGENIYNIFMLFEIVFVPLRTFLENNTKQYAYVYKEFFQHGQVRHPSVRDPRGEIRGSYVRQQRCRQWL